MSQMRGTTILWSQFIVAAIGAVLALQTATQYVAHKLGHQPQLGEAAYHILGYPMYWPWQYWVWLYHFDYYAKAIFFQGSLIIYGGMFGVFMVLVFMSVNRARRNRHPDTYGSARWAKTSDLKAAGLLADDGLVLAQTQDRHKQLLRHDGPEHCFVFAPTRSGKGVGIVIPTLLSWRGSVIVYDMKRENWDITAGWRQQFSHVLRFEPTASFSVRFNPLLEVRIGENEVRDVQNIADILVDPDGSKERMDHWEKTGHSLLVGVILHVLYAEQDKTLRGVAGFLSDPERSFYQTLNHMLACKHLGNRTHPVVASAARELLNKSENELSGVLSTAMSFLGLYRDPVIARNTAVSDFAIADLIHAQNPLSLYIVIPPSDADRTKPLVRLMLNQIGRRLTESMDSPVQQSADKNRQNAPQQDSLQKSPPAKHQLLMLLDEFPTLGRLTFFETELAYMAGYGIRALMIAQSLNQVEKAYGPNNAILDNSHLRITYGTLDDRTAKRISEMLGTATENRRQTNYAGHRLAPWLGHVMVSEQDSPRPLLTPGEVLQFPQHEALVLAGGHPPYRALKVRYFNDARFKKRVGLPCPNEPEAQQTEFAGLRPPVHWLTRRRAGRQPAPVTPTPAANTAGHHRKTRPATRKPSANPANQSGIKSTTPANTAQASGNPAVANNSGDSGGVRLNGEVQQHPEQGRELEQLLAGLAEQKRLSGQAKAAQREQDSDPTKEKDELMEQLERIRRNRQQINQRTIEQARQPGGGGLPL